MLDNEEGVAQISANTKEREMANEYEKKRNIEEELYWATVQRSIANGQRSPCLTTIHWGSFDDKDKGCSVYHSFFSIAEILGLVSSPRHHLRLYLDQLKTQVLKPDPHIWIPAAATPRTYDMVRFAQPGAHILATDLCGSPLLALGNIFAGDISNGLLKTNRLNVLDFTTKDQFDAIAVDAFITRFSDEDKMRVLKIFFEALKKGGVLLTTVRIPNSNEKDQVQLVERETFESSQFVDRVVAEYIKLISKYPKLKDGLPYTEIDRLREDAIAYRKTMSSSHAVGPDEPLLATWMPKTGDVLNMNTMGVLLSQIGFTTTNIHISEPIFDITNRQYLQICAIK